MSKSSPSSFASSHLWRFSMADIFMAPTLATPPVTALATPSSDRCRPERSIRDWRLDSTSSSICTSRCAYVSANV